MSGMEANGINESEYLTKQNEFIHEKLISDDKNTEMNSSKKTPIDWDKVLEEQERSNRKGRGFDWSALIAGTLDHKIIKAEFGEELYRQLQEIEGDRACFGHHGTIELPR